MSTGWIKIHRSIEDNPLLKDMDRRGFWVTLLMLATHKPRRQIFGGRVFELQPGQFVTTERALAERCNLPKSTVRRWLSYFQEHEMVDQQTDQQRTLVTIVNWAFYQGSDEKVDQKVDQSRTTNGPETDQFVDQEWTAEIRAVQGLEEHSEPEVDHFVDHDFAKSGPDTRIKNIYNYVSLVDATQDEIDIIEVLASVENYPLDPAKDLKHIRMLSRDYPDLDLLVQAKAWATYKLDHPLKKKSNPRMQFRNWCAKAREFSSHARAAPPAQEWSPWSALDERSVAR